MLQQNNRMEPWPVLPVAVAPGPGRAEQRLAWAARGVTRAQNGSSFLTLGLHVLPRFHL